MTLVFLHSFGGSARSWDGVVAGLAAPCAAPNLRGFGGSDGPPGPYDVDSYVADVLALIAGFDEYVLVGHSMGGKFALAAAARRPRGLRSLVLVAPSPPTPEPMEPAERHRLLEGYGDRAAMAHTFDGIVRLKVSPEVREVAIDDYLSTSARAWRGWLEVGSREDVSDRMAAVAVPVHVVVGSEDPVVGPATQRTELLPRLSNGSLIVVPGAGHLLPLEAPESVIEMINKAL